MQPLLEYVIRVLAGRQTLVLCDCMSHDICRAARVVAGIVAELPYARLQSTALEKETSYLEQHICLPLEL